MTDLVELFIGLVLIGSGLILEFPAVFPYFVIAVGVILTAYPVYSIYFD